MESYKFVKELGQGGYGQVWLMKDESNKKQFVLKQVKLHCASRQERQEALVEVKLLSTLDHPNIVSYLDSFHDSRSNLFILMAFCERGDMYDYIKKRNGLYFKERQIIHWFIQLLLALKYLHEKHILHRDLKTENLYLTRSKLIKIGDLGIAKILNGENNMARTMVGTPFYMSPEVLSFKPYNHKSDIWGLGCCMYEIITLERAFPADDFSTLVEKVKTGKVASMPDMYDKNLIDTVLSMFAYSPENRPSALEIMHSPYIKTCVMEYTEFTKNSLPLLKVKKSQNRGTRQKINSNHAEVRCPNINSVTQTLSIEVPDINGNGDGNDNSQQRPLLVLSQSSDNSTSNRTDSITTTSTAITSNLNENRNCNIGGISKLAQNQMSIKFCPIKKYKGKQSMEFLMNLAKCMKQARNSNNPLGETYTVSSLPRIKQPLKVIPNHPNTHSSISYYNEAFKRSKMMSPSVKSDSEVINSVKDDFTFLHRVKSVQRSRSTLDVNNENSEPVNIVLSEARKIFRLVRGSSADCDLSKCSMKENNVSNGVLTEVLNCEKVNATNVAARQRRREKLRTKKSGSMSSSAESLPANASPSKSKNCLTRC